MRETVWPSKPEIFTVGRFSKKVCYPSLSSSRASGLDGMASLPLEGLWPGASVRWVGGLGWLRGFWGGLAGLCPHGLYLWVPRWLVLCHPGPGPWNRLPHARAFADLLPQPHSLLLLVGGNSVWKLKDTLATSGWSCMQTATAGLLCKGPCSKGPSSPWVPRPLGLDAGYRAWKSPQRPGPVAAP